MGGVQTWNVFLETQPNKCRQPKCLRVLTLCALGPERVCASELTQSSRFLWGGGITPTFSVLTAFKNAIYTYYVLSSCTQDSINSSKNKKREHKLWLPQWKCLCKYGVRSQGDRRGLLTFCISYPFWESNGRSGHSRKTHHSADLLETYWPLV